MTGYKPVPSYNTVSQGKDYYWGIGLTAEQVAKDFNISREDQDVFSFNHMKAIQAIKMENLILKLYLLLLMKYISMKI